MQISAKETEVLKERAERNGICKCGGCLGCCMEIEASWFSMSANSCVVPAADDSTLCPQCDQNQQAATQ